MNVNEYLITLGIMLGSDILDTSDTGYNTTGIGYALCAIQVRRRDIPVGQQELIRPLFQPVRYAVRSRSDLLWTLL